MAYIFCCTKYYHFFEQTVTNVTLTISGSDISGVTTSNVNDKILINANANDAENAITKKLPMLAMVQTENHTISLVANTTSR